MNVWDYLSAANARRAVTALPFALRATKAMGDPETMRDMQLRLELAHIRLYNTPVMPIPLAYNSSLDDTASRKGDTKC
jgi:hypothetical protein